MDPSDQTQTSTAALQWRSGLAAIVCRGVAVAIPLAVLASWGLGTAAVAALAGLGLPPDHNLSGLQRGAAAGVSLLPALALARALCAAAACFDGFAGGDWFGPRQPGALATAGRWLIWSGLLGLVAPTALGLILSLNAAPGARVLVVTVSSQPVLGLLFGALIWALGHVWSLARAIAAENARFV